MKADRGTRSFLPYQTHEVASRWAGMDGLHALSSADVIPRAIRQTGLALFNQQMWCWGYDIRRASGNLLIQYGFVRLPAPPRVQSTSSYQLKNEDGFTLTLWGFGMHLNLGTQTGMFIRRSEFVPLPTPSTFDPSTVFSAQEIPPFNGPQNCDDAMTLRSMLMTAIERIAEYEQWVIDTVGSSYRNEAVAHWPQRRKYGTMDGTEMAAQWQKLLVEIRSLGR